MGGRAGCTSPLPGEHDIFVLCKSGDKREAFRACYDRMFGLFGEENVLEQWSPASHDPDLKRPVRAEQPHSVVL